jgi:hypothetical protein
METVDLIKYLRDDKDKLQKFFDKFSIYYEHVEQVIQSDTIITMLVDKAQKLFNTLESKIKTVSRVTTPIDALFEYYAILIEVSNKIHIIMKHIQKTMPDLHLVGTYSSSGAHISEGMVIQLSELIGDLENITDDLQFDATIIGDKIINMDLPLNSLATTYAKLKNNNAIDLYTYILSYYIEVPEYTSQTLKLIEELKKQVLSDAATKIKLIKPPNTIQKLLTTHNLSPGKHFTIDQICKQFNIRIKNPTIDLLGKAVEKSSNRIGLIIMYKFTGSPLENSISSLIDKKYITDNNLDEPRIAGVSNKTLMRTNTRTQLDRITKSDNILVFTPKKCDKYYLFDSLDNILFRELKPWYNVSGDYAMPSSWLELESPQYIADYSSILNDSIIKYIQKPYIERELLSRSERQSTTVKYNIIRNEIKKQILSSFDLVIKKNVTPEKFKKVISDPSLYTQALQHISYSISSLYIPAGKKSSENLDLFIEEVQISTTAELNYIQQLIVRTMAQKAPLKINEPRKIFSTLLDDILKRFINEKSNIFMTIEDKSEIASKTLLR